MNIGMKSIARLLIVATPLLLINPLAAAANVQDQSEARKGIQATIDKTNALLASTATAKEIANALYEDDLMIIGEGENSLYRGLGSFLPKLEAIVEGGSHCTLDIVDPIRHSGDLAVAFIAEHCAAAKAAFKDADARVLWVFRKGTKGWRVTMEMFGWGTF
jgi:ketosteroid isomerase-like protein